MNRGDRFNLNDRKSSHLMQPSHVNVWLLSFFSGCHSQLAHLSSLVVLTLFDKTHGITFYSMYSWRLLLSLELVFIFSSVVILAQKGSPRYSSDWNTREPHLTTYRQPFPSLFCLVISLVFPLYLLSHCPFHSSTKVVSSAFYKLSSCLVTRPVFLTADSIFGVNSYPIDQSLHQSYFTGHA